MLYEVITASSGSSTADAALLDLHDDNVLKVRRDAALADAFGDRGAFGAQLTVLVVIVERSAAGIEPSSSTLSRW